MIRTPHVKFQHHQNNDVSRFGLKVPVLVLDSAPKRPRNGAQNDLKARQLDDLEGGTPQNLLQWSKMCSVPPEKKKNYVPVLPCVPQL